MKTGKLKANTHIGTVIEDDLIALDQLCRICGTNSEWIFSLVHESIIEPEPFETELPGLRFSGKSLTRARTAMRLQRDLGVNLEGIALVLELMEEVNDLRAQLTINNKTR